MIKDGHCDHGSFGKVYTTYKIRTDDYTNKNLSFHLKIFTFLTIIKKNVELKILKKII